MAAVVLNKDYPIFFHAGFDPAKVISLSTKSMALLSMCNASSGHFFDSLESGREYCVLGAARTTSRSSAFCLSHPTKTKEREQ